MADVVRTIQFDPDDLTFGEMVEFEDIAGVPIGNVNPGNMSARMLLAVVYISGHRDDPAFTLDDARQTKIANTDLRERPRNPTPPEPLTQLAPARRKRAS